MSTKRAPRGGERGRPGREGAVSDSIKLSSVTLDCPDAGKLAAFYAEITGGEVTFLNEAWATVDGPGGRIDFQTAPAMCRSTWPDPTSSMQMHLDFYVDDLETAEARVLAAGATKFDFQPNEDHCHVPTPPVTRSACPHGTTCRPDPRTPCSRPAPRSRQEPNARQSRTPRPGSRRPALKTTALTARETAGYRSGSISLVSTRLHERGSPRPPPLLGRRGREVEP
jgi:Glyoxalase-like domain